ncbi:UDP-N-acetylmuramate dehydrogenase [Paracoccaceae bacterium]|nr:UDP-N-acetylmuramate dehydrogenase [Paracoccaceae bacterium]
MDINKKSKLSFVDENQFLGSINYSFPLSKISWLKVGGPVDILFRPKNLDNLSRFLSLIPGEVDVMPIGACSNLLVRDGGLSGVAVKLGGSFSEIEIKNNEVKLGAGNLSSKVAVNLSELGYDLSFLRTIPGTIGGAIAMNAGCYGNYIGDYVRSVEGVDKSGKIIRLSKENLKFKYRCSRLPNGFIVTSAILKPKIEKKGTIEAKMKEMVSKREETQPIKKATCGSTFKNPDGKSSLMLEDSIDFKAWSLIDRAGLRGKKMGKAMVSKKHPNFLINLGGATSEEMESLGEYVRKSVYEKFKVSLDWEVIRVGRK